MVCGTFVAYNENFEEYTPGADLTQQGWTLATQTGTAAWNVVAGWNGSQAGMLDATGHNWAGVQYQNQSMGDMDMEADLGYTGDNLFVCFNGSGNMTPQGFAAGADCFQIDVSSGAVHYRRLDGAGNPAASAQASFNYATINTGHFHIQVRSQAGVKTLWINQVQVIQVADSTYSGGKIGFTKFDNQLWVDNLQLRNLNVSSACISPSPTSTPVPCGNLVAFNDNFEQDTVGADLTQQNWTLAQQIGTATWSVVGGWNGSQAALMNASGHVWTGVVYQGQVMTDMDMEADLGYTGQDLYIWFNSPGAMTSQGFNINAEYFYLNATNGGINHGESNYGGSPSNQTSVPYNYAGLDLGHFHIQVRSLNGVKTLWINGALAMQVADDSFNSGKIGFSKSGGELWVDNLQLRNLDVPAACVSPSPTYTQSSTPSGTPTVSPTYTSTASPTATFTASPTNTASPTPTFSDSPSSTDSPTGTFTDSPTPTASPTATASSSATASAMVTLTGTATPPATATPVQTLPACGVLAQNSRAWWLRGSGDGEVEMLADGKLHLQKKITGLGAFTLLSDTLPMPASRPTGWVYGDTLYLIMDGNGYTQPYVYAKALDAGGQMTGSWAQGAALPWPYSAGPSAARWMDKVYVSRGISASSVLTSDFAMATLNADGSPGPWTILPNLPQVDYQHKLYASTGYLYYIASVIGNVVPVTSVYRAPILKDGTLGAWASVNPRVQANAMGGSALAGGRLWYMGGSQSPYNATGTTDIESASLDGQGNLGTWSSVGNLPQSFYCGAEVPEDQGGTLYVLGGIAPGNTSPAYREVMALDMASDGSLGGVRTELETMVQGEASSAVLFSSSQALVLGGFSDAALQAGIWSQEEVAPIQRSSANAPLGTYRNRFDACGDLPLGGLNVQVSAGTDATRVQLRWRSATAAGAFGPWSALGPVSQALNVTARYLEYELVLNGAGTTNDVSVDSVQLSLAANTPTATATPSTSASPTPASTLTPTPTLDPSSTATDSPTQSMTSTYSDSPTATFTDSPTPTATDSSTANPTLSDSPSPSDTASPTQIDTPSPSNTPSPTPVDTTSPTASPTPTSVAPTSSATASSTTTASPGPTSTPVVWTACGQQINLAADGVPITILNDGIPWEGSTYDQQFAWYGINSSASCPENLAGPRVVQGASVWLNNYTSGGINDEAGLINSVIVQCNTNPDLSTDNPGDWFTPAQLQVSSTTQRVVLNAGANYAGWMTNYQFTFPPVLAQRWRVVANGLGYHGSQTNSPGFDPILFIGEFDIYGCVNLNATSATPSQTPSQTLTATPIDSATPTPTALAPGRYTYVYNLNGSLMEANGSGFTLTNNNGVGFAGTPASPLGCEEAVAGPFPGTSSLAFPAGLDAELSNQSAIFYQQYIYLTSNNNSSMLNDRNQNGYHLYTLVYPDGSVYIAWGGDGQSSYRTAAGLVQYGQWYYVASLIENNGGSGSTMKLWVSPAGSINPAPVATATFSLVLGVVSNAVLGDIVGGNAPILGYESQTIIANYDPGSGIPIVTGCGPTFTVSPTLTPSPTATPAWTVTPTPTFTPSWTPTPGGNTYVYNLNGSLMEANGSGFTLTNNNGVGFAGAPTAPLGCEGAVAGPFPGTSSLVLPSGLDDALSNQSAIFYQQYIYLTSNNNSSFLNDRSQNGYHLYTLVFPDGSVYVSWGGDGQATYRSAAGLVQFGQWYYVASLIKNTGGGGSLMKLWVSPAGSINPAPLATVPFPFAIQGVSNAILGDIYGGNAPILGYESQTIITNYDPGTGIPVAAGCGPTFTPTSTVTPVPSATPSVTATPTMTATSVAGPMLRAPGAKQTPWKGGPGLVVAPNPARGDALAHFELAQGGNTELLLMDLRGSLVRTWALGDLAAGPYMRRIQLEGLAPGLYFLALQQEQAGATHTVSMFKLAITP